MNVPNIYVKLYSVLYNRRGIPNRLLSPLRFVVRRLANWQIPIYLHRHPYHESHKPMGGLVVSFTSFPARIEKVWLVVESLKRQTCLPEKIILWLSKEQFPNDDDIPKALMDEVDNLFEIRIKDDDLRSYKKIVYALLEYPNKTIVTVDDDIYYHPDTIFRLVEGNKSFPNCIIANVTARLTFKDNSVMPYERWCSKVKTYESNNLVQKGVGGVLYPPHSLHPLTTKKDLFMLLSPFADDLWLNAMARLVNTPIVQSSFKRLLLPIGNSAESLNLINVGEKKNDSQLADIRKYIIDNFQQDLYALSRYGRI